MLSWHMNESCGISSLCVLTIVFLLADSRPLNIGEDFCFKWCLLVVGSAQWPIWSHIRLFLAADPFCFCFFLFGNDCVTIYSRRCSTWLQFDNNASEC